MSRRGEDAARLLNAQYANWLEVAKAAEEVDFPNTIEGDLLARDHGTLNKDGLAGFLDDLKNLKVPSWAGFRLIQRAAASYDIDVADEEKWPAIMAVHGKLALLALLLIRDYRLDLYELKPPPSNRWSRFRKMKLASDVGLTKELHGLPTDQAALELIHGRPEYAAIEKVDTLKRQLGEGRRLWGQSRGRGRPRKMAASGPKKAD